MLSTVDLLTYLQITVAVMLIVVLYHILFVAVDLRKILRRIEEITQQLEDVLMKPISMADSILQFVMDYIEDMEKKKKSPKPKPVKAKKAKKK